MAIPSSPDTVHLLLVLLAALVVSAQNTCPTFGSSDHEKGVYNVQSGLFLNLNNTAQCNGTVTSWTYCFHRPWDTTDERLFSAVFMVYRRRTRNSYTVVPNSMNTVTLSLQDIGEDMFGCRTLNLNTQFRVQENDVIGACLADREALTIVSFKNGVNRHLYRSSNRDCSDTGDVRTNNIEIINSFTLHLQADIRNSDSRECTIGSNSQRIEFSSEDSRTLIDTQHPSPCSGIVTAWHLCYYIRGGPSGMYTAQVGVWRERSNLTLAEGSFRNLSLELRHNDQPEPILACTTKPVTSFLIQRGDIVGVVLPDNRPLPIVAAGGSGTQLLDLSSKETIPNRSLHLYAVVQRRGGASSSSVALAVVLVLLTAIGAAVTFIVIALYYWWRQRQNVVLRGSRAEAPGAFKKGSSTISKHYRPVGESAGNMHRVPTHYKPKKHSSKERQRNSKVTAGSSTQPGSKKCSAKQGSATPMPDFSMQRELSSSNKPPRPPPMLAEPLKQASTTLPKPQRPLKSPIAERYETCDYLPKEIGMYVYAEADNSALEQGIGKYVYADADYSALLEQNIEEDIYGLVDHYKNPASDKDALYAQLRSYGIAHIKRGAIRTLGHLGSGQFGSVELGEWNDGPKKISVALKTLNRGSSSQETVKFLQEAATMVQFRHPNVINLHGVIVTGEPLTLVVELADGDLLEHLHRMHNSLCDGKFPNASELLMHYSLQVGLGMQYLSAKGFVHRDLAARNILIKDGTKCKIADFGMSRDLADLDGEIYISSGGKIPIKWTAPEAVQYRKYSTASDIWSYGCVLYEIWSLGAKPFSSETNTEVMKLLKSGFRLPPPPGCPRVIYEAMIHTWNPDPERRPAFRDTVLKFLCSHGQHTLRIPEKDARTHPEAAQLGADLEAGLLMYRDLQERYRQRP